MDGALAICSGSRRANQSASTSSKVCRRRSGRRNALATARSSLSPGASQIRNKNLLSLLLENGETKTYRNDPKACANDDATNCVYYGLGGYHPAAHIYLILIQYYEGSGSELVSARTGKTLSFSGVPHFSPDGSNFIVIDNDLAYGGSFDIAVGSNCDRPTFVGVAAKRQEWSRSMAPEALDR